MLSWGRTIGLENGKRPLTSEERPRHQTKFTWGFLDSATRVLDTSQSGLVSDNKQHRDSKGPGRGNDSTGYPACFSATRQLPIASLLNPHLHLV